MRVAARFRSSASKTRARRSQCPGPELGSGAVHAGGLRTGIPSRRDLTGSPSRLPDRRYHDPGGIGHTRAVHLPPPPQTDRAPINHRRQCAPASLRCARPVSTKEDGMKLRSVVVVTVLAALVLSGCGAGEKISPQLAMRDAANSTVKAKQGTFTFSIVGAESDLNAVLNEGAKLSEEDRKGLRLLSQSHISLTTAPDVFALDVKVGDVDHAVELRYVGKKGYLRADVPALVKLMGASTDEVNATVEALAQNGFGFLKDAAAGKWLTADFGALGDTFKGLARQLAGGAGGGAPATTPTSAPTASQFKQAKDAIGKALHDNTS